MPNGKRNKSILKIERKIKFKLNSKERKKKKKCGGGVSGMMALKIGLMGFVFFF